MYNFYSLSTHGYLAVPYDELKALSIEKDITSFSYHDVESDIVYLEEDQDALTFIKKKINVMKDTIEHFSQENIALHMLKHEGLIRNLPAYKPKEEEKSDGESRRSE